MKKELTIHKPLIPSINTIPQYLFHHLYQSLFPPFSCPSFSPFLNLQPKQRLQLLRFMLFHKHRPWSAARDSETMACMLGCGVVVGGADEGDYVG
jgi:hypothetical protein